MISYYIDTSYYSIAFGLIVFVLVFFMAKYLLTKSDPEVQEEGLNYKILGSSIIIAIVVALVCLLGYKQFIIFRGSNEMIEEEF